MEIERLAREFEDSGEGTDENERVDSDIEKIGEREG